MATPATWSGIGNDISVTNNENLTIDINFLNTLAGDAPLFYKVYIKEGAYSGYDPLYVYGYFENTTTQIISSSWNNSGTPTPFIDTDVVYVEVQAYNVTGTENCSNPVNVIVTDGNTGAAWNGTGDDFSVLNNGNCTFQLTMDEITGTPSPEYIIYVREGVSPAYGISYIWGKTPYAAAANKVIDIGTWNNNGVFSKLTSGLTYYIQVQASNSKATINGDVTPTVTITDSIPGPVPIWVGTEGIESIVLTDSFDLDITFATATYATSYVLYLRKDFIPTRIATFHKGDFNTTNLITKYEADGSTLIENGTYYLIADAKNAVGVTTSSTITSIIVPARSVPVWSGAGGISNTTVNSDGSITVSWNTATGADYYILYEDKDNIPTTTAPFKLLMTSSTSAVIYLDTDNKLLEQGEYWFKVQALNEYGTLDSSITNSGVTPGIIAIPIFSGNVTVKSVTEDYQYSIEPGETYEDNLVVYAESSPLDLTGHNITYTIKSDKWSSSYVLQYITGDSEIVIINAKKGYFRVRIPASETIQLIEQDYFIEIKISNPTSGVVTISEKTLTIEQ